MTASLTFTWIGDEDLVARLHVTAGALDHLIDLAAEELAKNIATEAASVSSRLGAPWDVIGFTGTDKKVVAPEFFAHFLAGGTVAHGPRVASRLMFAVDGTMVFAKQVSGIGPNPFDERAVAKTQGSLDSLVSRIIEGTF